MNHRRGVERLYRYENPGIVRAWATRKGLPTGHGCPSRIRHIGGKTFDEAYPRNRRSHPMLRIEKHKQAPCEAESRDASGDGGWTRSSDEEAVMALERRGPRSRVRQADNYASRRINRQSARDGCEASRTSKSRVMGDCQARLCERLGVKFPRPTRQCPSTGTSPLLHRPFGPVMRRHQAHAGPAV